MNDGEVLAPDMEPDALEPAGASVDAASTEPAPLATGTPRRRPRLRMPAPPFLQALFAAYVYAVLLLFTFLVPPFQKSDEPMHWHRAVSLTNLQLTCAVDEEGRPYAAMKRKHADLPLLMHQSEVTAGYGFQFDRKWLRTDFSGPSFSEQVRVYDICNLAPPGYLASSLGILLGKPFTSPLVSFYTARLAGAVFFVAAVVAALRIVPSRYAIVLYGYAALPIVLHQVTAVSYDAVHLSLFPVVFALLTRFLEERRPVPTAHLLALFALLWWTVNVRSVAFYGFALLALLLPPACVAATRGRYLRTMFAYLGLTAATTALLEFTYIRASSLVDPAVGSEIRPFDQVRFMLEHPGHFLAASYRALDEFGEAFLRQGIGVFGWIDYGLNFAAFYVVVAAAAVVAYRVVDRDERILDGPRLALLWGIILVSAASFFVAMYLVWTPVGGDVVLGVQGRYFLGLAPFALLAASQTAVVVGRRRLLQALGVVLAIGMVASIATAIFARYY